MAKPIIGVVGGIGSGKSLVAAKLARHGACLIEGDKLGHEALRQPDIKAQVTARWGRDLLDENGEIQRRRLGRIVFADVPELRALESIVFPYIGRRIVAEIERAQKDPQVRFIVLDAAVLMEAGWDKNCDRLVFVAAPRETRLERLRATRGWSEEEFAERERMQWPLDVKQARAQATVVNAGACEQVTKQVERLVIEWGL